MALHLLEVIQESGRIPAIFISDTGAAQSLGDVEQLVTGLRSLVTLKNTKILRRIGQPLPAETSSDSLHTDHLPPSDSPPLREGDLSDLEKEDWGPPHALSSTQIEALMERDGSLYRLPLSTGPPANKGSIPSSLGLIDSHCKLLGQHLRKDWDPSATGEQLAQRIKAYVIHHNYMHQYARTGMFPAQLHLSRSQYLGRQSLFHLLGEDIDRLAQPLVELKLALEEAHSLNNAKQRILEEASRSQREDTRKHGTLLEDSIFLERFPRLGLVLLYTPQDKKFSQAPNYSGPALVLARQTLDRNLLLLHLATGQILKRSYRQVRSYLPNDFFNLPEEIRDTLQSVLPVGIVETGKEPPRRGEGLRTSRDIEVDHHKPELETVLYNILTIFNLIKDSLPSFETDSPEVISFDEEDGSAPEEEPEKEVRFGEDEEGSHTSEHLPTSDRPQRNRRLPARYRE